MQLENDKSAISDQLIRQAAMLARYEAARKAMVYETSLAVFDSNGKIKFINGQELENLIKELKSKIEKNDFDYLPQALPQSL